MEPTDPSSLSSAAANPWAASDVSATMGLGRGGTNPSASLIRERLRLAPETPQLAADWALPNTLAIAQPLSPAPHVSISTTAAIESIALPRPKVGARARPERARREYLVQRLLEMLPGATALLSSLLLSGGRSYSLSLRAPAHRLLCLLVLAVVQHRHPRRARPVHSQA